MSVRLSRHRVLGVVLLSCIATAAVSCGGVSGEAFATRFADNRREDLAATLERMEVPEAAASEQTIAVGVASSPPSLYTIDLRSPKRLWQQPLKLQQTPFIAGNQVVYALQDQVEGRDLKTGAVRFSVPTEGMSLVGADGAGDEVVFTLSKGLGTNAESELVLVRGSSVAYRLPLKHRIGAPAWAGGVLLAPWGHQYLSAVDSHSGRELARLRVNDAVISQALFLDGQAYAGGPEGLTPLLPSLADGRLRGAQFIPAPTEQLPGSPPFVLDFYDARSERAPSSAAHSIRLEYTPQPDGSLRDGQLYAVFYRYVMALTYPSMEVRWVYTHDQDLVGARSTAGGVYTVDRLGNFTRLAAASGQPQRVLNQNLPTQAALLPRGLPALPTVAGSTAAPLHAQLNQVARDDDTRLVPMQRYAVQRLAELAGDAVTTNLLALCNGHKVSATVRGDACLALASREQGQDQIVAALDRHYDHLTGSKQPAVGPLAKAVQQLGATEAYPLLVSHLEDPHTPGADLVDVVHAIANLNPDQAPQALSEFAYRYHADPVDDQVIAAVEAAMGELFRLRGPIATETLIDLAEDPLAMYNIHKQANHLLAELEEAARVRRVRSEAQAAAKVAARLDVDRQGQGVVMQPAAGPPERLTLDVVERTLRPVRHELRQCLAQSKSNLFHGRLVLVVEAGEVMMVSVTPTELQPCVESLVRAQDFPVTRRQGREQISYILHRK